MSKRAKELLSALHERIKHPLPSGASWTCEISEEEQIALIDAELRKTLERAAEKVRLSGGCWMYHNGFKRPASCSKCYKTPEIPGYCAIVTAILAEEED